MSDSAKAIAVAAAETAAFVSGLPLIISVDSMRESLGAMARTLGFSAFVLGQMPSVGYEKSDLNINNYPPEFVAEAYSEFRFGDDPVLDHLMDAETPFMWEELPAYKTPTPGQAQYLAVSRRYGFSRGYTVPLRVTAEPIGAVSYATPDNGPVPRDMLPFAMLVATAAYSQTRTIIAAERERRRQTLGLTHAEISYLKLLAQGKGEAAIALIEGCSVLDLKERLQAIRRKLGLNVKISLVLRAMQLGYFTFNEALNV